MGTEEEKHYCKQMGYGETRRRPGLGREREGDNWKEKWKMLTGTIRVNAGLGREEEGQGWEEKGKVITGKRRGGMGK